MATRNGVSTKAWAMIGRLVSSGRNQNTSQALRARLTLSLEEARRGELAEGSGDAAIRRAFRAARNKATR